ncbi:endolytic transglycosylase MltG [Nocardioides sp. JQ2195]|uniref:endolytic transglycosylase MltG n=1 Tax=Nocardioides sp. JQ2195 TaxID=2592334 RepID=UPI00143E42B9|nr:endolytic transglycosylase MltG [Nocardioides sp. JQ2195]QIX26895.1 endolytic transglycosylase MltG [Nocardioides sp. JQ2195]
MTEHNHDQPADEGLDQLGLRHDESAPDTPEETEPAERTTPRRAGGSRRGPARRGGLGCILVLVVVGLLVAGIALLGAKGINWVKDQFGEAEDYTGPGSGSVVVVVDPGDTATDIGRALEESDVVASVEAFTEAAARRSEEAAGIQPGSYGMKKKMKADDALSVLVDPKNRVADRITIPEGLRAVDVVALLAKNTDFSKKQFEDALSKDIGLPAYADGNAEGYLFPATYEFEPKAKPVDMLRAMVTRWRQAADKAGLEQSADKLGYTPQEVMTVAALVEAEGRGDDMPKIARVIYNRLENPGTAGTIGRLDIDATVNYALGRNLGVAISTEEIDSVADSPYNTRRQTGLPPGPIEAPGDEAIRAALNPTPGDWYYYVTVDLKTGETKFAESYDEFLQYKAELNEYCTGSEAC